MAENKTEWTEQLRDLTDRIVNREKFDFDVNGEALMKQYRDQFRRQGQTAMMDTMGQAQAMTGGYGNSYAQSVGQQTYQNYMQGATDKIPELYQLALSKYQAEGSDLMDKFSILADRESSALEQSRYNQEREENQRRYEQEWAEDQRRYNQEWEEDQRRYNQEWAAANPTGNGSGGGGGNPVPAASIPTANDAMHQLAVAGSAKNAEKVAMDLIARGADEDTVWAWYGRYYDDETNNKESRVPSSSGGAKKNINRVIY